MKRRNQRLRTGLDRHGARARSWLRRDDGAGEQDHRRPGASWSRPCLVHQGYASPVLRRARAQPPERAMRGGAPHTPRRTTEQGHASRGKTAFGDPSCSAAPPTIMGPPPHDGGSAAAHPDAQLSETIRRLADAVNRSVNGPGSHHSGRSGRAGMARVRMWRSSRTAYTATRARHITGGTASSATPFGSLIQDGGQNWGFSVSRRKNPPGLEERSGGSTKPSLPFRRKGRRSQDRPGAGN